VTAIPGVPALAPAGASTRVSSDREGVRGLATRSPARLVLILGWIVPGMVASAGMVVVPSRLNPDLSFVEIVVSQLAVWLPWAGWSWLVAAVSDRWPMARDRVWRALAVHIPLCVIVVTGQILVVDRVSRAFGVVPERALDSILAYGLRSYGDLFTVIYWAIVGAHAAIRWHEAWRAEAVRAAQLTSDLAQAQLAALRAQLHPHFLFNALNAVVALVGEDPAAARRVTVRLAELLRATLAATERTTLPLREELELTGRYLEIEQVRFGPRLVVEWTVDPALLDVDVPAFVLQPLVENALTHAVAPRAGGGRVSIQAARDGERLQLTVCDDGPGPREHAPTAGSGTGLRNLRDRLARLHGSRASLLLERVAGGGARARVSLPLTFATPPVTSAVAARSGPALADAR
jgi:signal transduction histidine kinase